ncbi:unnamed protein product [Allacma fusca]|uniref:EF-hand domain-containing protein n=1 Tax=Allacma fusca TaxID=39272 RepID=A0A8J2NRC3_9HEXA|nr:unnamed protein product [Allacma fusca]
MDSQDGQVIDLQSIFAQFDKDSDGLLNLEETYQMMETLGDLENKLKLEELLQEMGLDRDNDLKTNFQEFLIICNKSQAGDEIDSLIKSINWEGITLTGTTQIAVHMVGVAGAKNFFERKAEEQKSQNIKYEKRRITNEARQNRFLQKLAFFSFVDESPRHELPLQKKYMGLNMFVASKQKTP